MIEKFLKTQIVYQLASMVVSILLFFSLKIKDTAIQRELPLLKIPDDSLPKILQDKSKKLLPF